VVREGQELGDGHCIRIAFRAGLFDVRENMRAHQARIDAGLSEEGQKNKCSEHLKGQVGREGQSPAASYLALSVRSALRRGN